MSEIIKKNLSEIIDLIKKKEIKSEELTNLYINKVNKSIEFILVFDLFNNFFMLVEGADVNNSEETEESS